MNREPGICGNDRKFETWLMSCPTGAGFANKQKQVVVYAVPEDGYRGARVSKFRASYDGVVFEDTDIIRLRESLAKHHIGIQESEYEKVLIVEASSGFRNRTHVHTDEFSLTWSLGWVVRRLGFVYDETRTYKRHDVPTSAYDTGFRTLTDDGRGKPMVVVPWTQAREDALAGALVSLKELRERVASLFKDPEAFATKLDSCSLLLLGGTNAEV